MVLLYAQTKDGDSPKSSFRPLYDGTNYTFPDTTSPAGIAELLEVSFVKACMQLASGYVDVLKLFIAAAVAGYEFGFSLAEVQQELSHCERQTANRPLMDEEEKLRFQWLCIVYLTCEAMQHPTKNADAFNVGEGDEQVAAVRDEYEPFLRTISSACQSEETTTTTTPSVEELLSSSKGSFELTQMEKAILSQSLRVATLTPVVIEESKEANRDAAIDPPKPPIKGAFD
jgi:hypothetical protein